MYLGELHAGAVIFHANFGIGRVVRLAETCVICKFASGRRKLAHNAKVAVWAMAGAADAALPLAA